MSGLRYRAGMPDSAATAGWWEFASAEDLARSRDKTVNRYFRSRPAIFHSDPDCSEIEHPDWLRKAADPGAAELCSACTRELAISLDRAQRRQEITDGRYAAREHWRRYHSSAVGQPGTGRRR